MNVNIRQIQIILSLKKEEFNVNVEELKRQVFEKLVDINASNVHIIIDKMDIRHSSTPRFTVSLSPIQPTKKK